VKTARYDLGDSGKYLRMKGLWCTLEVFPNQQIAATAGSRETAPEPGRKPGVKVGRDSPEGGKNTHDTAMKPGHSLYLL
jgi:hypothetical protein